jgi:hypothetical protein
LLAFLTVPEHWDAGASVQAPSSGGRIQRACGNRQ